MFYEISKEQPKRALKEQILIFSQKEANSSIVRKVLQILHLQLRQIISAIIGQIWQFLVAKNPPNQIQKVLIKILKLKKIEVFQKRGTSKGQVQFQVRFTVKP